MDFNDKYIFDSDSIIQLFVNLIGWEAGRVNLREELAEDLVADVVEQTDPEQQLVVEPVQVLPAGQPEVQDSAFCVVENFTLWSNIRSEYTIRKDPEDLSNLQPFSYIENPFLTLK